MLVRMKTSTEIEGFAAAGRIAGRVRDLLAAEAVPGRTTLQLESLAENACREHGVHPAFLGYRGFPGAICTSVNEELVHGIPGSRILREGDLLKIDIGVEKDGFLGDTACTVRVGGPRGDELDRMALDCRRALARGIAAARNGCDLGDIGDAISRTAREGGWGLVLNYGGHGMERGVLHADPFVANARLLRMRLRAGMVLALEPMFVAAKEARTWVLGDGWTVQANGPAVHFEDTLVVAETGEPQVLTRSEEE
jgi:methionyl aminopeptidase